MDRRECVKSRGSSFILHNEVTMKGLVSVYMNEEEEDERYPEEGTPPSPPVTGDDAVDEAVKKAWSNDRTLLELPMTRVVCGTCRGTGSHVNPNIDYKGITKEEFAEDPEFAEAYFDGFYDVTCYECGGNNVTLVIDNDSVDKSKKYKANLKRLCEHRKEEAAGKREVAAELAHGA
jgi:hypothetical protein